MARSSNQTIGSRIVKRRTCRHWTQADLCTRTRLSQSQLSRYETGRRTPSVSHLAAIAKALACTVDDLIGRAV